MALSNLSRSCERRGGIAFQSIPWPSVSWPALFRRQPLEFPEGVAAERALFAVLQEVAVTGPAIGDDRQHNHLAFSRLSRAHMVAEGDGGDDRGGQRQQPIND